MNREAAATARGARPIDRHRAARVSMKLLNFFCVQFDN